MCRDFEVTGEMRSSRALTSCGGPPVRVFELFKLEKPKHVVKDKEI